MNTIMLLTSRLKKEFLVIPLLIAFLASSIYAQKPTDGPYIFIEEDHLRIQYVLNGLPVDTLIPRGTLFSLDVDTLPKIDFAAIRPPKRGKAKYEGVEKVFAISDVHGQYELMLDLLIANDVISEDGSWTFGKGHLVITGDNFDRGERVMDILWFLYHLEQEAEAAGGKVHPLLGNHEVMVLNNDLRYLHRKYRYTSGALQTRYDQLFRQGSVIGDWLSSHNVLLSINGLLFAHGGVSLDLLKEYKSIDEINDDFVNFLIRREGVPDDEKLSLLGLARGPLWYRGYFDKEVNQDSLDLILSALDQDGIIVGHTSQEEITSLFDGKLLAIDCSIKLGEDASGLLIKDNRTYTCGLDGKRKAIQGPYTMKRPSLFDAIHDSGGLPKLEIHTDVKRLIRQSRKEEYQESITTVTYDNRSFELPTQIRARGNVRKMVCRNPPLKINFKGSHIDSLGFADCDKLKLVIPCNGQSYMQEKLYSEFFIYGLYQILNPYGIRARLVQVVLKDGDEVKNDMIGFLVEDEEQYENKHNAIIIESGIVTEHALERSAFLKLCFFQYMISNTDWSVYSKHNVEIVKMPEEKRIVALPYDFDYSGFVDQNYAVPNEKLPIESVKERYFMAKDITPKEVDASISFFLEKEEQIFDYLNNVSYFTDKNRKVHQKDLEEFFDMLRRPKLLKRKIVR